MAEWKSTADKEIIGWKSAGDNLGPTVSSAPECKELKPRCGRLSARAEVFSDPESAGGSGLLVRMANAPT